MRAQATTLAACMRACKEKIKEKPGEIRFVFAPSEQCRLPVPQLSFVVSLINGFVASFHPKALPPMLRSTYSRELTAWMFLPLMLGAVEGGAVSIIVKKAFDGAEDVSPSELNFAVAVVAAAPNIGNITSFIWASLSHGRPKIKFISGLQIATALCTALIGLVPHTRIGLYALLALVCLSRIAWTGVITNRTAVWGANYPRADRARIAGKMATVQSLGMALVGTIIGIGMDWDERAFHILFPLAAVGGLVGNAIYRKVRLRGQRRLARLEVSGGHAPPSMNPLKVMRVLRHDKPYRWFMIWLFVFGTGNLMLAPPLAIVLNDRFNIGYWGGIQVLQTFPLIVVPIIIPLWSRLLDRRHVVEFRAIHAWAYVLAALLHLVGALAGSLWVFYAASIMMGIANAGGVLAWNLGHHDFAPAHRDAEYMGVHVTLNGIRGLLSPFLAVWIYQSLDAATNGSGVWIFSVCLILNTAGALGFVSMARRLRRGQLTSPHKQHHASIRRSSTAVVEQSPDETESTVT